ncbi:hypothetical protein BDB00DRAFT_873902 [Zychaea mexicana]|uniref:uncharacterized protein n=1 Tax=Zychaea mexicana TaxID=64656 RepID=UPI0022FE42BC|nr:uncharacterized protein BDB00DRAFT_873902 [Zychaea mexicana]KAI9491870.1 hypothetical protein BDB00DRAFT_873902 [Zychaea mexicana]
MPAKKNGNQRNGKTKKTKRGANNSNNSNNGNNGNNGSSKDNNEFYSVKTSSVPSTKLPKALPAHDVPYATVQTTTAFPASHVNQEPLKGFMRTIATLINRLLTVSIVVAATYYVLRGHDATKINNRQCTASEPIKQNFAQLLKNELYKVHVEPYTDTMRAWYDEWSPDVSDQAKLLQSAALDRALEVLDRAKTIRAQTIDHAKGLQTVITDQLHAYLSKQHPTASTHDDGDDHENDAFDDYYSATMTPYETQLPDKEIQAILTVATQARTKLDEQLRTVQHYLPKRFEDKQHTQQQQQPVTKKQREAIRSIAEEVKSDMDILRKNAESQVIEQAKTARKAIDDETELTAIRQAERAALIEVHKSDILIVEIRLEVDHYVEAIMKKWIRQAPLL